MFPYVAQFQCLLLGKKKKKKSGVLVLSDTKTISLQSIVQSEEQRLHPETGCC